MAPSGVSLASHAVVRTSENRHRARAPSPSGRELVVATVLLLVLGGAVWGSHIFNGGFYWADDWYHARLSLFPEETGLFANRNPHTTGFRPVLGLLLALPYRVFGLRTELHLALAIILAVGASTSFYWLLRTLGLERVAAWVSAGLVLLFPWSDSSRLWATGSINNVALMLFFGGAVLSLRGLRANGRRATTFAVAGAALYTLAVLTYEVVGGAVLASVAVYAWWAGPRRAVQRWMLDLLFVVPALAYVWMRQPRHHTDHPSVVQQVSHAWHIGWDAVGLLWSAAIPAGLPHAVTAAAVLTVIVTALATWRLLPRDSAGRATLQRWLVIAAVAAVTIVVAYVPFVPGLATYVPSAPGVQNRVNLLAAFGFVVLVYSLAMLTGTLLARLVQPGSLSRDSLGRAVALLVCLSISIGYIGRDARDKANWALATRVADHQLETIARLVPEPAPGSVIYVFGDPTYVAPGVPVFALAGDLKHAVKVKLRSRLVTAFPMRPPTRWVCGRFRMYPEDYSFGRTEGATYGRGIFISIPQVWAVPINSEAECRLWSRYFGHPPKDEWPR